MSKFGDRYSGIELISLMEANRLVAKIKRLPMALEDDAFNPLHTKLRKLLDVDLRVTLSWNTNMSDVDLHVIEPSTEVCKYNHRRTTIGGLMSNDMTSGYGPEAYLLKKTMPGEYQIKAHYYGARGIAFSGPATLRLNIYTNFGRPNEKKETVTLRLDKPKDMIDIAKVKFD